ncbi:MAG: class B sortase [Oscillospiraceae bacterium]|nr:class B sortase [Oscillospiraceae bacterium]
MNKKIPKRSISSLNSFCDNRKSEACQPSASDFCHGRINKGKRETAASPELIKKNFDDSFNELVITSAVPKDANKKSGSSFDIARYLILAICAGVFLYSSYNLVSRIFSYIDGRRIYNNISDMFNGNGRFTNHYLVKSPENIVSLPAHDALGGAEPPTPNDSNQQADISTELTLFKINQLKQINPDTYGYIYIPVAKISYPLVQTNNNSDYLEKNFYGDDQPCGAVFVDYRNSRKLTKNRNTVIYAHRMDDGSMFGNLHQFKYENIFDSGTVEITTNEGIFHYRVFCAAELQATYNYYRTDFESDDQFLKFAEEIQSQSKFKTDIVLKPTDKIITLSTCMVNMHDYRFVVFAVLTDKTLF